MNNKRLEIIDDNNWEAFRSAPFSVLVLTNAECSHCKKWKDELSEFISHDNEYEDVRFGVVTLDGDNVSKFHESNKEWLDIVDGIPFNAIFVSGEPKTSFYGDGLKRLLNRLKMITKT